MSRRDNDNIADLEDIYNKLPDEKERRRHALLQAAAILKANVVIIPGSKHTEQTWWGAAVSDAERLLAEIERREGS